MGGNIDIVTSLTPDQKLKEVKVAQAIDGSLGAYAADDVVSADDCCTTLAITWIFEVAEENGGKVKITDVLLINETENQAVQYDLILFNGIPSGELRDNFPNDNPLKGDRSIYQGVIVLPQSASDGATIATTSQASRSTTSGIPLSVKCAYGSKNIYGVLVARDSYTQTATDDIEITLFVEPIK